MNTIRGKYIGKALSLMLLVGTLYACSNDNDPTEGKNGEGKPIELSVSLNAKSNSNTRASENPDDYGQESKIYSLEVFVFKPTGELDGYEFIAPELTGGTFFEQEYKEIYEIKGVKLTAGQRHVYVIANPPLKTDKSSEIFDALPSNPKTDATSLSKFRDFAITLQQQGYVPPVGNKIAGSGDPIGGIQPNGYQTWLTMTAYVDEKFSNEHTQHYLGYATTSGIPENREPEAHEKALTKVEPLKVERLVSRVMLKEVSLPKMSDKSIKIDGTDITDYEAYLSAVFMLNVQSQVGVPDETKQVLSGKFVHGYQTGYDFLKGKIGNPPIADSDLFTVAAPKTTLEEDNLQVYYYKVENYKEDSSPIWFYAFENQLSSTPTYLVLEVTYHYIFNNVPKTVSAYYPVVVNKDVSSSDHDYIQRNYQYEISVNIKDLGDYPTNSKGLTSRSLNEMNPDEVMTVEQTAGRNLFPWTGNVYY